MHKIILQFGLLVFALSVIFFSRLGMPVQEVLLRAFLIFIFVTVMISLIAILFIRSVNKISYTKQNELTDKIDGK